jgi:hypothetical protein
LRAQTFVAQARALVDPMTAAAGSQLPPDTVKATYSQPDGI